MSFFFFPRSWRLSDSADTISPDRLQAPSDSRNDLFEGIHLPPYDIDYAGLDGEHRGREWSLPCLGCFERLVCVCESELRQQRKTPVDSVMTLY
jgi:hypothetical protein